LKWQAEIAFDLCVQNLNECARTKFVFLIFINIFFSSEWKTVVEMLLCIRLEGRSSFA